MQTGSNEVDRLRKQYGELAKARKRLEERLLYIPDLCPGNLSAIRHKLKKPKAFGGPYYYLSRSVKGHRQVIYISAQELPRMRALTEAWRTLQRGIRQLKRLNAEILGVLRRIGEEKKVKDEDLEG
jgi:hypothetical protein